MFYDRFVELCSKKGVAPTRAAIDAGISKSLVSKWKANEAKEPSPEVVRKLAEYFGISKYEVLEDLPVQKEKAPSEPGESSVPHAQYREILADSGIRLLLDADANVPQESIDDIVEFIKFKQRKNGR